MDGRAKVDTFAWPVPECRWATARSTSRKKAVLLISRQISQWPALDVLSDTIGNLLVATAGTEILSHLLVPLVILPAVEPFGELTALGQAESFDRLLDFFHLAHGSITILISPSDTTLDWCRS